MGPTKFHKVILRALYSTLRGSIDVGLLGENHHKINLVAQDCFIKGVVPLLWIISYTTLLIIINP